MKTKLKQMLSKAEKLRRVQQLLADGFRLDEGSIAPFLVDPIPDADEINQRTDTVADVPVEGELPTQPETN